MNAPLPTCALTGNIANLAIQPPSFRQLADPPAKGETTILYPPPKKGEVW